MGIFNFLFQKNKTLQQFIREEHLIVDVRTPQEFRSGHIPGAINIPLQQLENRIDEPRLIGSNIITCCRSGLRSGKAQQLLQRKGFNCINGGNWQSLARKLNP